MSSLTTTLEPPSLELEYRTWEWKSAMRRARIAIVTASAMFLLLIYSDILFFGIGPTLAGLVALRLSTLVLGVVFLALLAGPPRPARFDRLVIAWTAWAALLTAVILPASRPAAWILHGFIVCAAIPAVYLVFPLSFLASLVTGIGMGAGYLAFVIVTNGELTYMQGAILTIALFGANLFGAAGARSTHQLLRANFLQQRSLRRAEENLNLIVDAVPFPVVLLDRADRHPRRLNDAARALFGGPAPGASAESAVRRLVAAAPELVHADAPQTRELSAHVGPGEPRWLLVSARPITHDGVASALLSFVDITARKEAEDALARAKRDADDASRAKSTFLATMSHEMRTPLHGVLSAVQLLERAGLGPADREYVDIIRFCARGMLELVDGILELARADASTPARVVFEPRALVRELANSLAPRLSADRFILDADATLPARFAGDAPRIRRVLSNLLDNALKYGDASPIAVELRVLASTPAGTRVRFAVTNGGPGIPPAARPSIFEPFVQVDLPGVDRRGFGLGLAICKQDVEAMGGTLVLEDAAPHRTTFAFELTLAESHAPLPSPIAAPDLPPAVRTLSLLIAEDDPVSARLGTNLLELAGHRVTLATTGADAVARASAETFDAILMDMRLPVLDGAEATRQIRALPDPARARVPIIATTANAMAEDRARYLDAGVTTIVPKPIDFGALEATLASSVAPARHTAPTRTPDAPYIDAALLRRYTRALGAAPAFDLLALCVDTAAPLVTAIESAVARLDTTEVARRAHQLASAAHSAAFTRLGNDAARIEDAARADAPSLAAATAALKATWDATRTEFQRAHRPHAHVDAVTSTPSR